MVLVDTDVLVDCLRGTAAAQVWLATMPAEPLNIPGVAAMELIMGCRNQADLRGIQKFLGRFVVLWPEAPEFALAYDLLAAHRLSTQLSIPDCLIAAMAITRRARLYTFNLKHFRIVEGLEARQPYARPSPL